MTATSQRPPTSAAPGPAAEARGTRRVWRVLRADLAVCALFAVLALAFVGPSLLPGRALLPIDALFGYPPWQAHADNFGVSLPHNPLIADAILQNYSWKRLARESFAQGELPLWNPYILSGQPFMASGQNGSLYPLGVLFYVLPLASAYGWFIGLHLWIGAIGAYWLARTLGATRLGGTVSGLTFGFCGYLVVSFLWPMVVSTAVWLPMLLAVIERQMQRGPRAALSSVVAGGTIVGLQFLAGHLEMSLYLLLTAGLYTAPRIGLRLRADGLPRPILDGLVALTMVLLGTGLAAIQLVPFAEVIGANVRGGWSDYQETIGYALPKERLLAYLLPDLFGNPTHHTYYDVVAGETRSTEHTRPNGERRADTEWGGKNYVEGTVYLGVLPLLLALLGLLARPRGGGLVLAILAVVSLLFAFGTPAYALLFYGIPGVNQLHTPFRWVYPLTVCAAALAGLGVTAITARGPGGLTGPGGEGLPRRLAVAVFTIGAVGLLAVGFAYVSPGWGVALAGRALRRWRELQNGFGSPEMLFSYQWANIARAAALLTVSGFVIWLATTRRASMAGGLAVLVTVLDLFSFGIGFNAAADTRPLSFVPRSIAAIKADPGLFRVVTFGEDDTLPSNTNMLFGLQDIRGYDTIILREYVEYLERIEPQRGIPYSKVAKLFDQRSLSSPLLDLLNVKYVLTSKVLSLPGWTLHAQGDGIRVYRNERAMPRAFVVGRTIEAPSRLAALDTVGRPGFDPRTTAVVENPNAGGQSVGTGAAAPPLVSAEIAAYENNRVVVRADGGGSGGTLVLADVYFPGWTASVDGQSATVLRANGLLRAVQLAPGPHTVEFRYRPLSVRVGALLTGISGLVLAGLVGYLAFGARTTRGGAPSTARRVLRNSAFPMASSLLNKVVDLGFALITFRVLGAEGVGAYTFAGVLTTYFDVVVGWGLGTLITRDVAQDRSAAGRYLGNGTVLRLILWCGAAAITALLTGPLAPALDIDGTLALAIWLLVLGLLPGLLSGVVSALFMAHERMDVPAAVTMLSTISKVVLGLGALLVGYGYVGLAAVSIVTNVTTLVVLLVVYGWLIGTPRPTVSATVVWSLVGVSFPLMINGLLNQLFFKIDVLLLKPLAGDLALGWYSTAYKLIDGLQVIPASFVLALFPLLARYAAEDRARMVRLTDTGLKILLVLAFPIAVGTTLLAEPIILLLAGQSYLPESARALQILIWYLPISFANGLLQYVLISVNRQRTLSVAFAAGVVFNVLANVLLIPTYGYVAAALVTVASEVVLLAPFLWVTWQTAGPVSPLRVGWRPALAAAVMALPVWLLGVWSTPLAILGGAATYAVALLALQAITPEERQQLRALLRR
ncbi:MAG: oligosaccharide flippase family protein [Chloroflexi bacterium]|nr:oligosaccharide flippase family protein [Chloroflexota bacterium]